MKYSLLMYDIENDKVRTRLFKYLKKQEGIPLQKSVWIMQHFWKGGVATEKWIRSEIVPKLKAGDQIHIWPLPKTGIKRLKALKSHIDLSFLQDGKDDMLIV